MMTELPEGPLTFNAPSGGSSSITEGLEHSTRRMRRHVASKIAGLAAAFFLVFIIQGLARNSALQWSLVGQYLFSNQVIAGLERTLLITCVALAIAVVLGVVLANMRLSENRVLRAVNAIYVWFFRSIPLLVLLILAFNFSLLYQHLSVGIPFGPAFFTFTTTDISAAMTAAFLTFGFQQAAYTSEVIRAAILSVPKGQTEAAEALGMTHWRTMLRIVLPQAARIAIPPVANESINLCKSTALVAFVSLPDLLYSVQEIYSRTFQVVPLLIVATIWYTVIVSILSLVQWWLEKKMTSTSRGDRVLVAAESL